MPEPGIELGTLWSEGRDLTNCANHARTFTLLSQKKNCLSKCLVVIYFQEINLIMHFVVFLTYPLKLSRIRSLFTGLAFYELEPHKDGDEKTYLWDSCRDLICLEVSFNVVIMSSQATVNYVRLDFYFRQ